MAAKAQADSAALVAELSAQAAVNGGQALAPAVAGEPLRASPAMAALRVVALNVERLFVGALMRMRFFRLTNCAYRMNLQNSNLRNPLIVVRCWPKPRLKA